MIPTTDRTDEETVELIRYLNKKKKLVKPASA